MYALKWSSDPPEPLTLHCWCRNREVDTGFIRLSRAISVPPPLNDLLTVSCEFRYFV